MANTLYVGIGSSAGGLHALEKLVAKLPKNMGYVYIIAQHLDPNEKSSLAEILSRSCSMPVYEINEKTRFYSNKVYIIPSGHNLIHDEKGLILENISLLSTKTPSPSVDALFEALAIYKQKNAVGIILTGSGHDGTIGIQKIKEQGGITIAQNPQEAQYTSMPKSAIESLCIDHVLEIDEIADYLSSLVFAHLHPASTTLPKSLSKVSKLLYDEKSLNLLHYKPETILRRINKRMQLLHVKSFEDYSDYVSSNSEEIGFLYNEILIGVTHFFRDKEYFEFLKKHLLNHLSDKPNGYELRIWCVACSSGEEAYSLAIMVDLICNELQKNFTLTLFATDIDNASLNIARVGTYAKELLQELDPEIIEHYFVEVENGYKVINSLRSKIIFTHHNILSDPPFIAQDLISCRNFLIYIQPEVQHELFELFHYALKEDGLLFLGSSESIQMGVEYFNVVDSDCKIYKKEKLQNPPRLSSHYFSKHSVDRESFHEPHIAIKKVDDFDTKLFETVFKFLGSDIVVVDRNHSIVYKKGHLPFLRFTDGFVTLNIMDNINKTLRYELSTLLERAFESKMPQQSRFVQTSLRASEKTFVRINAYPFEQVHNNFMMILYFQTLNEEDLIFDEKLSDIPNNSGMLHTLSKQLSSARDELEDLSSKLKLSKESMQLLNEELQSSNEELQSSNEELETSNEELQSTNEELIYSINTTKNLQNQLSLLLNSTQDGIIGLDLAGDHTFANSAALKMLGYSEDELIGRNGHTLWHHTKKDGSHYLYEECSQHHALEKGISTRGEELFWRKDGSSFEVSVLQNPIIEDGKIKGAVLSFQDITELNRQKTLAHKEHQLSDLFMSVSGVIVLTLNTQGAIVMINQQGAVLLGSDSESLIGKNWFDNFLPKENLDEAKAEFQKILKQETTLVSHYKTTIIDTFGNKHLFAWTNSILKDKSGNITGIISSGTDISHEEELSKQLRLQEQLFKATFEEADVGIAHVSLDGRWVDANNYLCSLLGYTEKELQALSVNDITHIDDLEKEKLMISQLMLNHRQNYHTEKRYIRKDGTIIWVNLSVVMLEDELHQPLYLLKIIRDISQLKLLMFQLEREKSQLKDIIEFTPLPLLIYDKDGHILLTNKAWEQNTGYTKESLSTMNAMLQTLFEDKESAKLFFAQPFMQENVPETQFTTFNKTNQKRVGLFNTVLLKNSYDSLESYAISSIIDITELKESEEIMISQSRQAAMGDMLSMIAHQWRQPLSVIAMAANNLKAQMELEIQISEENLHQIISTIDEQTNYLSHTIDDFRNFFKPDKVKEKVHLSEIFKRLTTLIDKSLQNNSIQLLLPQEEDYELLIYSNGLVQVLLNLIGNAKDAIKEHHSVEGMIKISLEQTDSEIIMDVRDNGGGIDKSVIDSLAQPYITTKAKNGTGLGLYMSKIIVTKHLGGRLFWKSDADGSDFYIALPKISPQNEA